MKPLDKDKTKLTEFRNAQSTAPNFFSRLFKRDSPPGSPTPSSIGKTSVEVRKDNEGSGSKVNETTTRVPNASVSAKFITLSSRDPLWMPDKDCDYCFDCQKKFTTFRRKHHCRVCGQIFCMCFEF